MVLARIKNLVTVREAAIDIILWQILTAKE